MLRRATAFLSDIALLVVVSANRQYSTTHVSSTAWQRSRTCAPPVPTAICWHANAQHLQLLLLLMTRFKVWIMGTAHATSLFIATPITACIVSGPLLTACNLDADAVAARLDYWLRLGDHVCANLGFGSRDQLTSVQRYGHILCMTHEVAATHPVITARVSTSITCLCTCGLNSSCCSTRPTTATPSCWAYLHPRAAGRARCVSSSLIFLLLLDCVQPACPSMTFISRLRGSRRLQPPTRPTHCCCTAATLDLMT